MLHDPGSLRVLAVGAFEADSPRAHAVNVTKTAGGFARLGHAVTLATLAPAGASTHDALAEQYAEPSLQRVHLRPDRVGEDAAELALSMHADMVYARSFAAAEACARAGVTTVLETHAHVGDRNPPLLRSLPLASASGPLAAVVTISASLRAYYMACGASADRVHVVPDGVDLELFTPPATPPPPPWGTDHRPHAVYAGHLYDYKGIPTLLEAASLMSEWSFELVGGTDEDIESVADRVRAFRLGNVRLHGRKPHAEVPRWLWRADALVLPPVGTDPSAHWTSPVKLGEYLASGVPVVASDIPGLRAWVDQPEVTWFRAGDAESLASALRDVRHESAQARAVRRLAARRRAEAYCYPERARRILQAAGLDLASIGDPRLAPAG